MKIRLQYELKAIKLITKLKTCLFSNIADHELKSESKNPVTSTLIMFSMNGNKTVTFRNL